MSAEKPRLIPLCILYITDSSLYPRVLQYVDAPLINNAECGQKSNYKNAPYHMETIADNQLCAGYLDGTIKDSCKGDSGGPLVLPLSASDDSAIVIGVVSFGPQGCALKGTHCFPLVLNIQVNI